MAASEYADKSDPTVPTQVVTRPGRAEVSEMSAEPGKGPLLSYTRPPRVESPDAHDHNPDA